MKQSTRKKPVTTEELFDIICKILKEKGKMPDILDYGLATHSPVPITNYEYGLKNKLDYWGNEGIYLDLWIEYTADMEMWNMTEDDLYRQFRENMEQDDRSELQPIANILARMVGCLPEQIGAVSDDVCMAPIYVLSNTRKLDGAVEMLNKRAMEKAAETISGDFYILPSSIHETILVPVMGNEDGADELAAMVSYVNRSEVLDTPTSYSKGERSKSYRKKFIYTDVKTDQCKRQNAGRYGFVKLQCYSCECGFDSMVIFTDSEKLFYEIQKLGFHRKSKLMRNPNFLL